MLDGLTYDIVRQALHTALVPSALIVAGTSIAGILVGVVQSATSVHDTASSYAIRLLALGLIIYLMFRSTADLLISLLDAVFTSIGSIH